MKPPVKIEPDADLNDIDLERIVRFVVVAEELSFTRAAQRLGIDQAWLSRQIQQLEQQLGFPLLKRNTRRVELSPDGESFLHLAIKLAEAVKSLAILTP